MPIDPMAVATTSALVHAVTMSASVAMPLFLSRSVYRSFDQDGIGQRLKHPRDARIVRRPVVDVPVDNLQPSLQIAAGQVRGSPRPVDHQVHLGHRTDSAQGHEVPEAADLHAAETPVELHA